jgi:SAM-dependent methyltransferase
MANAITVIERVFSKLVSQKEYVVVSGSIIAPPHRRYCGPELKDDNIYIKSAEHEANRLVRYFECSSKSSILDVGCGQGRLAIGLLRILGEIDYTGIDIDGKSIAWCKDFIAKSHPTYKFHHLNLYNERYNTNGKRIDTNFEFDLEPGSMDIIYLFSVFSHTTEEDMKTYLKEFARLLKPNGKIFFTAFAEEDVPDFSVNPDNYRLKCSGPLHVVRYRKEYLSSIIKELGYSILDFTHSTEIDGQSAVYLTRSR